MAIASINPATGETLRTFDALTDSQLDERIERAWRAFEKNRARSFADRAKRMNRAAQILEERSDQYARVMTAEMGKPLAASVAEVKKCALVCRYYATNAEAQLAKQEIETDAHESYVRFEPIGPVLAVMPWNFPFWQVFRFAAPALMAGNTGLLKHASNVPQCALAIEEVFHDGGFDSDEFQTLLIGSGPVTRVIENERVRAVTLTGSEAAGANVAATAATVIKRSVLELGGSDPFIVMPSADFEAAVTTAVKARVINNGQSCIAAKRFIVHAKIYDKFEKRFVELMEALKVGDPFDKATDIGPLAMPQLVDDLDKQVRDSIAAGARLLTGGKRVGDRGNFYAPTVLADIPKSAPAYYEETFGPAASLFRVADVKEAIAVANDTSFGLGASAWTTDRAEADAFIAGIESGQVFINAMVASDPRVPFGGTKRSGFGRELAEFGIREFVNVKTIWVGGAARLKGATE